MSLECKLAKLALNLDMSGKVQPCNLTDWYLEDKNGKHFNVLTDDLKNIWHSDHRKKLLEDHKNGIQNPTCNFCWESEKSGVESTRQRCNERLKDIEEDETQPRVIILKPSNLCNNACRSCNPHTSSMWYKDDYKLSNETKTYKEYLKFFENYKTAYKDNALLEKIFLEWEDNIVLWDMYGGEPLIVPLFYKLLDQASSNKNVKQKTFNLHTNGTIYKDDLVKTLSLFKESHIGFSIDAIGKKNNYIRYGSVWEDIIQNFKLYKKDCEKYTNVKIAVRTTLTPWNIFYYDEVYNFFKKINVLASGLWCFDKPYNDLRYLPREVKQKIIDKLFSCNKDDTTWNRIINDVKAWMLTEPKNYDENKNTFMHFNKKLDKIRKETFGEIFPEYNKLFL